MSFSDSPILQNNESACPPLEFARFLAKVIARQTIFEGRVQGVGFRYSCKELAKGYDLTGTVANLPDGTVKVLLQGELEEIEEYLQDLSEESAISHHIKGQMTTSVQFDPTIKGFLISK